MNYRPDAGVAHQQLQQLKQQVERQEGDIETMKQVIDELVKENSLLWEMFAEMKEEARRWALSYPGAMPLA